MKFIDLQKEVKRRLSIFQDNTFYTEEMIKNWINIANKWACAYKPWPFTEKAKYTLSVANQEEYDYPEEFMSDSIRILKVDGEIYEKVRYEDYFRLKNDIFFKDKIFTDFNRIIFIYPVISVSGKEILIFGQEMPRDLINDTDETPFAYNEEEGEEAIIKYALKIALQRGGFYDRATIEGEEARLILENIWGRISGEQSTYLSKSSQYFKDIQFF